MLGTQNVNQPDRNNALNEYVSICLYRRVIFMASSSGGSCAVLKSFIHRRRRCEVGAKHVEQAYSSHIFIARYMQL